MALFNSLRAASSVAAIAAGLMAVSVPAYADMESLLEKLRDKGILSEDEFNEMRQDVREARREAAMDKVNKANSAKTELKGVWKDGFGFTTGDGEHSIKLTGRVQTDYRWGDSGDKYQSVTGHDVDTSSSADGFELRRARFGVQGFMYKDINYKAEWNLVGGAPVVDEAYANFAFYKPIQLTMGRFKQPFSLEQLTSSNSTDFAERSYVDQNGVPAKKLGAMLSGEPIKGITYAASVFQEGFNEVTASDGNGKRYAGRLTANLAQLGNIKNTVLHFGGAYVGGSYQLQPTQSTQSNDSPESVTRATLVGFRTMNRGLSNIYRVQVGGVPVCGGSTAGSGSTSTAACYRSGVPSAYSLDAESELKGLETALAYGPLKLQGEYSWNNTSAVDPLNPTSFAGGEVKSFYVQSVWNVTGEKWADMYSGGVFKGVKPTNNFKPGGGWGAVQLALRFSQYDAKDMKIAGSNTSTVQGTREQSGYYAESGKGFGVDGCSDAREYKGCLASNQNARVESYGIGLNWILNPNTKFMFEYTRTDFGGETAQLDIKAGVAGATNVGATSTGNNTGRGQGVTSENLFSIRGQYNF